MLLEILLSLKDNTATSVTASFVFEDMDLVRLSIS